MTNTAIGGITRSRLKSALSKTGADDLVNAIQSATASQLYETVTVVTETLTLTNAVKKDMTAVIPAGAIILGVFARLNALTAGDASGDDLLAKVGVGITGSVVKYGVTSALTKNSKVSTLPTPTLLAASETLGVYGVKADGSTAATEKFVAGTTVTITVRYKTPVALASV